MPQFFVLVIALGTCGATLAGGALALRLRDRLHLVLGFSAGAIIAVAFFDLLPEAIRLGATDFAPTTVLAVAALGFFAYTTLDRLILLHSHDDVVTHLHGGSGRRQWAGAASLSVHSFLDGFAIGMGFRDSAAVGIVIAAAVLAHDCSDGMNTVNVVLKNGGAPRQALRWLVADAVAPVLGAAASFFVSLPDASLAPVLALFGGFFLYIGASDLLPETLHAHPKFLTTVMTLLGAGLLYMVVHLAG